MAWKPNIRTIAATSDLIEKVHRDILLTKHGWMGPSPWPVHISQTPICKLSCELYRQHRWKVMLVNIAMGLAIIPQLRIILDICNNCNGMFAFHFKPLVPFSPLVDRDFWQHIWEISPTTIWPWVIKCCCKALWCFCQVLICESEVENWCTSFGKKDKSFIWEIQQRITQQPPFCIYNRDITPFHLLHSTLHNSSTWWIKNHRSGTTSQDAVVDNNAR